MLFLLACFQRLYLVHHFVRYYHCIVQDGVSDPVFHNIFWKTVPVKILELICEDLFYFFGKEEIVRKPNLMCSVSLKPFLPRQKQNTNYERLRFQKQYAPN